MLSNPSTPFDEDGWADVIQDIRRLFLMAEGGSNDLNADSDEADQTGNELEVVEVSVCVNGEDKTMKVMGSEPY